MANANTVQDLTEEEQMGLANASFQKCLDDPNHVTPDEYHEAEEFFKDRFPDRSFHEFMREKSVDECMNKQIFDTRQKKYYKANVLSPIRRNKVDVFNLLEFLKEAMQNNQICYLNFDLDPDIDLDDCFDRQNIIANEALKSIASLALCLNSQRKDIPYSLIEINAEKYIH